MVGGFGNKLGEMWGYGLEEGEGPKLRGSLVVSVGLGLMSSRVATFGRPWECWSPSACPALVFGPGIVRCRAVVRSWCRAVGDSGCDFGSAVPGGCQSGLW